MEDNLATEGTFNRFRGSISSNLKNSFLIKVPDREGWVAYTFKGENVNHIELEEGEEKPYIVVRRSFYIETDKSKKYSWMLKEKTKERMLNREYYTLLEIHYNEDLIPDGVNVDLK